MKSILIPEGLHKSVRQYCLDNSCSIKFFTETALRSMLAIKFVNSKPDNYTERPKGNKVSNLTSIQKKKK